MGRYRFGLGARRKLRAIWANIAKWRGVAAADKASDRLEEVFGVLADQPGMGVMGACGREGVRRFLAGEFWIYYRELPDGIQIVDLKHYKQRQETR